MKTANTRDIQLFGGVEKLSQQGGDFHNYGFRAEKI